MYDIKQAKLLRESLRVLVRELGVLDRGDALCCGVTVSQSYTIVEIGRAGTVSVNLLSEILGVDKSTVSRSVDKLVTNGILVREIDSKDRRSISLSLSSKGHSVFDEIEKRATEYFDEVVARIPSDRCSGVIDGLQCLVEALQGSRCC